MLYKRNLKNQNLNREANSQSEEKQQNELSPWLNQISFRDDGVVYDGVWVFSFPLPFPQLYAEGSLLAEYMLVFFLLSNNSRFYIINFDKKEIFYLMKYFLQKNINVLEKKYFKK